MGQNAEKIIFVASNTHKYVAKEGGCNLICRRAPHGARGLKPAHHRREACFAGRAPHGARGLKRPKQDARSCPSSSRPARGAWIETKSAQTN